MVGRRHNGKVRLGKMKIQNALGLEEVELLCRTASE